MKIRLVIVAMFVVALGLCAAPAEAQTVSCTDSTNTNCTVKKNQPFQLTQDPALETDSIPTERYRLYIDGAKIAEQANTGAAAVWTFSTGLATTGTHTIYVEGIATGFSSSGQLQEFASGPSNTVTLNIVAGSLTAPKNVRIVK